YRIAAHSATHCPSTTPAGRAAPGRCRRRRPAPPADPSGLRPGLVDGDRESEIFPWGSQGPGTAVESVDLERSGQERGIQPHANAALVQFIVLKIADIGNRPAAYVPDQDRQSVEEGSSAARL